MAFVAIFSVSVKVVDIYLAASRLSKYPPLVYTKTVIQLTVGESFEQINNSHHLARKYARIFVRGHNLFREENSFQRAKLEENCELRGTDNVQGQISEHIFAPNGDYCLYYPSNLFRNARGFENW